MSHSVSLFSEVQLEALEPQPYKLFPIPYSLAQSAISDQTLSKFDRSVIIP